MQQNIRIYKRLFSLIELLTIILIILILIALLLPALSYARRKARVTICMNQLRGMATGLTLYANDNSTWYPASWISRSGATFVGQYKTNIDGIKYTDGTLKDRLVPYLGSMNDIPVCPLHPIVNYRNSLGGTYNMNNSTRCVYPMYFGVMDGGGDSIRPKHNPAVWMKKVGQNLLPGIEGYAGSDVPFSILVSDFCTGYSVHRKFKTNHYPLEGSYEYNSNSDMTNSIMMWVHTQYTDGNWADADGSVYFYTNIGPFDHLNGSTTMFQTGQGRQMLPQDLRKD